MASLCRTHFACLNLYIQRHLHPFYTLDHITGSKLAQVDPTKLRLCRPSSTHRAGTADPTRCGHQHGVGVLGSGPCLVFDDLAPIGDLLFLDHRRVGLHAVDGECFGEPVRDQGVGVESGEGDELPAIERDRQIVSPPQS